MYGSGAGPQVRGEGGAAPFAYEPCLECDQSITTLRWGTWLGVWKGENTDARYGALGGGDKVAGMRQHDDLIVR